MIPKLIALVCALHSVAARAEPAPQGLVALMRLQPKGEPVNDEVQAAFEDDVRTVAADLLGPRGYTVLNEQTTLTLLQENGVDPSKLCEASCELQVARDIKASIYIGGVLGRLEGQYVATLRLMQPGTGQQLSSLQLEAGTLRELQAQYRQRARKFFDKGLGAPASASGRTGVLVVTPFQLDAAARQRAPVELDAALATLLTRHLAYATVLRGSDAAVACAQADSCLAAARKGGADDVATFEARYTNGAWSVSAQLVDVETGATKARAFGARAGVEGASLLALLPQVAGELFGVKIESDLGERDFSVGRGSRLGGVAVLVLGGGAIGGGLYWLGKYGRKCVNADCSTRTNDNDAVGIGTLTYSVGTALVGLGSGLYVDGRAALATGNEDARGEIWWRRIGWGLTAAGLAAPLLLNKGNSGSGTGLGVLSALAATGVFVGSMFADGTASLAGVPDQPLVRFDVTPDLEGRWAGALVLESGF